MAMQLNGLFNHPSSHRVAHFGKISVYSATYLNRFYQQQDDQSPEALKRAWQAHVCQYNTDQDLFKPDQYIQMPVTQEMINGHKYLRSFKTVLTKPLAALASFVPDSSLDAAKLNEMKQPCYGVLYVTNDPISIGEPYFQHLTNFRNLINGAKLSPQQLMAKISRVISHNLMNGGNLSVRYDQ